MALTSTYYKWGILGGFVGAILMVLVMLAAGMSMGMPQALILRALGVGVLGIAPGDFMGTMLGGLVIHLITGTFIIASILVAVTLAVKRQLLVTNAGRGLGIGLLAGAVVYFVWGLPMLYLVMAPSAVKAVVATMGVSMTMAKGMLMAKIGYVAVAFFFAHLVYGATWGVLVGFGVSRASGKGGNGSRSAGSSQFKCPTCGAAFASKNELMEHGKVHMSSTPKQEFKCPACGATFASQQELMDHKAKAHPM
ncbi:MAG: C2H2-type zinc finger protein [Nitrososphaerota archaeon]|nr:C2H2-type zinc finger protein [Nitrososphaerota archaeon]MDG6980592.1 C2H2-type zinc finger protein [Nitrososphaerota archaeon]MDG6983674.1 C2H2-type zinc finger protein [Nitrososphaerota archaeon]